MVSLRFLCGRCLTAVALVLAVTSAQAQNSVAGGLHWRLVGPFRGGRALAVTGVPGSPETFYFGSVGGGVWKSENAGRTWISIFDHQPTASIGAIAIAPSDPKVIYVGSGEADMRNDIQQGNGMYRSNDGGNTWTHIGLADTRQIGKILIAPDDPETVYVAALGHQYGPNSERGVFKTVDGGKTWTKSLYKDPNTGAIDLAMDPTDSKVIFASMWQTRRPPWSIYPPSNGPGSGLYRSSDAGATWAQVKGGGFPAFVGRVGITISPAEHDRVYACVDTNNSRDGGIYRSDDGGATWTCSDHDGRLWGRGWYFCGITADPVDPDTAYVMNTSAYRSTDGGKNFTAFKGAPGGDDYHTCWIYPGDPNRMILGNDQGVVVSVDAGKTWSSWYNQPTGQFYHVATDNRSPYWIYGAQQDSGAMAVPSRTIHTGISSLYQRPIDAGGESGTIAPDPLHPGQLYASNGVKEDLETGWEQSIEPTLGLIDTNWRSEWTMPMVVSPVDPHVLYTSHQKLFRSGDGGHTWSVISPDLTRKTHTDPPLLDAATKDNNDGQPRRGVIYWIAPSPRKAHQIWVGTDDGLLWLTYDEGSHWQNVALPNLGPWSKIGIIEASRFDPNIAYVAIDRHRVDDNHPYILRTRDAGKHWKLITQGIPTGQFVNVVREDPHRPGLLYAGTDWGIFFSLDDGLHWQSLQLNLPTASVRDIAFGGNDVVVGTHGRAIWILDDPAPLRQSNSGFVAQTRLFQPSDAVLFQRAGTFGFGAFDEGTPLPPEETQGENAPWGAVLDYTVRSAATPLVLRILDAQGRTVRRFSSDAHPVMPDTSTMDIPAYWVHPDPTIGSSDGSHRWIWDLRNDRGILVPPGNYSARVSVNGRVFQQPLKVVRDTRVAATDVELTAQFSLAMLVADEISVVRALQARVTKLLKSQKSPTKLARLKAIAGSAPSGTPDEGGMAPTDNGSLRTIADGLGAIQGAVQSAPAAPTANAINAFRSLKQRVTAIQAELGRLSH